jgi:hypothetical protein
MAATTVRERCDRLGEVARVRGKGKKERLTPLGDPAIKAMQRPALHLGGALQLLFGIRGRRWQAMPRYAALMNEFWVRPLPQETPAAAASVDGGCYW